MHIFFLQHLLHLNITVPVLKLIVLIFTIFIFKGLYIKQRHFWEEKCWTLFQVLSVEFMQYRMLVSPFLKRNQQVIFPYDIIIIVFPRPKKSIPFVVTLKIIFLLVRGYVKCKCIHVYWMFEFTGIGFCITLLHIKNKLF